VISRAVLGLTALMVAFSAQRADAGFRVCNQSDVRISVALGYLDKPRGWVAEGWWVIDVGQCSTLYRADLDNRYYYVFAKSTADGGKTTWSGKIPYCIQPLEKFVLVQAQYGKRSQDDCAKAGLGAVNFDVVDTGKEKNHTLNLAGGATTQAPPSPPPSYQPSPVTPGPAPQPAPPPVAPGGGGGGTACQRYPNLC
jgi:uncharacterized membrane protein